MFNTLFIVLTPNKPVTQSPIEKKFRGNGFVTYVTNAGCSPINDNVNLHILLSVEQKPQIISR